MISVVPSNNINSVTNRNNKPMELSLTEHPINQFVIILFAAFVFSIPFETLGMEVDQTYTNSKLIGYAFFLSVFIFQPKASFSKPPKAFWLFTLYLIIYSLMGFIQPNMFREDVIIRILSMIQMLVLLWVGYNLLQYSQVSRVIFASLAISCTLISIFQILGITITEYNLDPSRLSYLKEDPNTAGAVLAIGIVVILDVIINKRWNAIVRNISASMILPLMLVAIVRTGSRGAVLALGCGSIVYIFQRGDVFQKVRNTILVLITMVLMIWITNTYELVAVRWQQTLRSGSLAERELIYPTAVEMILEKPFLGWGPVVNYWELGRRLGSLTKDTHNIYLWVLTEVGLFGAIPYFIALWLCIKSAWLAKRDSLNTLPLALLITVLAINMSLSWQTRKLHWFAFAYALAAGANRIIVYRSCRSR